MYKIRLTSEAKSQLKKLKISHKTAVGMVMEELSEDPYLGKPLGRGLLGRYTYRIGVYRIIYKITEKDNYITVLTVGHRSVVYN